MLSGANQLTNKPANQPKKTRQTDRVKPICYADVWQGEGEDKNGDIFSLFVLSWNANYKCILDGT